MFSKFSPLAVRATLGTGDPPLLPLPPPSLWGGKRREREDLLVLLHVLYFKALPDLFVLSLVVYDEPHTRSASLLLFVCFRAR